MIRIEGFDQQRLVAVVDDHAGPRAGWFAYMSGRAVIDGDFMAAADRRLAVTAGPGVPGRETGRFQQGLFRYIRFFTAYDDMSTGQMLDM